MARHLTPAQIAKHNAKVEKAIARDTKRQQENTCTVCKLQDQIVSFIDGKAVCVSCQRAPKHYIEQAALSALRQDIRAHFRAGFTTDEQATNLMIVEAVTAEIINALVWNKTLKVSI